MFAMASLSGCLLISARYSGQDAKLGIDDICDLTGLAPRTVKGAVSTLRKSGLWCEWAAARLMSVPLLHHGAVATGHRLHSPSSKMLLLLRFCPRSLNFGGLMQEP